MVLRSTSRSPKSPALSTGGEEAQRKRDKEMKDMVSALTQRLVHLQAETKQDEDHHDDKRGGRSIITLTGNNTGATMRFHGLHSDGQYHQKLQGLQAGDDDDGEAEEDGQGVYTNSNFQGFNNSLMLNGSYSAKDPGVHMVVSDHHSDEQGPRRPKGKSRAQKKDKVGASDSETSTTSDSD